jgi:hypothetical protein
MQHKHLEIKELHGNGVTWHTVKGGKNIFTDKGGRV